MQKIKKKKNIFAKKWKGKGRSHDLNAKLSSWARAFTQNWVICLIVAL
jgi:hypothetical protein